MFIQHITTTQSPMLDKPHSLEAAFPKVLFSNDHSSKGLFTTSTHEKFRTLTDMILQI